MNERATDAERVKASIAGRIGRIELNRPEALNALDLPMFVAIHDVLTRWREDPRVESVVITGNGRAFSAGGDVRAVRDAVLAGDRDYCERLYRTEYATNALIAEYPKPYIALVDGYCMGGGAGLAIHGSARVITEKAVFAMPETAIGYFPDIGCTYLLPRVPDRIGIAIGLLGLLLPPADAVACGFATHVVRNGALPAVEARLLGGERLDAILEETAIDPGVSLLFAERASFARAFAPPTVRGILEELERDPSDWAQPLLVRLRERSPEALATSLAMFECGRTRSLRECLAMELAVSRSTLTHPDFREGVRAVVIDKDRTPHWSPARIEDIDEVAIARRVDTAAEEVSVRASGQEFLR